MTAPVSTGLTALHEVSACVNCQHPVHSWDGKRGWIHTLTGTYRCPVWPHGWAEGTTTSDLETRLDEAAAEAEEIGREAGYEDGYSEGESEGRDAGYDDGQKDGIAEGRQAMYDELNAALAGALDELDDPVPLAVVRRSLTKAWNRVTP